MKSRKLADEAVTFAKQAARSRSPQRSLVRLLGWWRVKWHVNPRRVAKVRRLAESYLFRTEPEGNES